MYAPKTYTPLELIQCERPFVKVLPRLLKDVFCEGCNKRKPGLKACRQCLAVNYCSKGCQKVDWRDHKLECLNMKNLQKNDEDFVRTVGRVILKTKGKEWKSIRVPTLDSIATFDDINSYSAYMRKDPLLMLFCKHIQRLTVSFVGEESMPEENDLIEIIGKVKYNTFTKLDGKRIVGLYIFIGVSLFHHECIPTASYVVVDNVLKVWAIKNIHKKTEKISISYRQILSPKASMMDDGLVKMCKCMECTLPYGKSLLTKILNEEKAYRIIVESEKALQIMDTVRTMDADFTMEGYADELLAKQDGVLGQTNALRLRLLAFKCFSVDDNPFTTLISLKKLERDMRMVFGEYYMEMENIYEKLAFFNILIGNFPTGLSYYYKIKRMTFHITD